ncbi:hypothetical protein LPJ81_003807 [Coemansia sp. IMI 209127]|nr:hypothetical protein LPJ81_003807 [Coemansia sp. IMI 209127]
MAAATVAASISSSPVQAAKHATVSSYKVADAGKTKCPKCAHKIEAYAVDTNCSFRMCANLGCTWPFDCDNMAQCFEQDAAVPSMRKRAKKRKALASKEEQRRARRRQSVLDRTPNAAFSRTQSIPPISAGAASQMHLSVGMPPTLSAFSADPLASSLPFLTTPITANGVSENDSISQLDDWLADLCNSANANGPSSAVGLQPAVSATDYSTVLSSATTSSNMLLSQGKYLQDTQGSPATCFESNSEIPSGARAATSSAHGPCDNSYNEPLSPDWLESLLSSSSSPPPCLPLSAPIHAAGTNGGLLTTAPKLLFAQQQAGQIPGSSNNPCSGAEGASFIQQFSIDGALGHDCTFLPSAAPNNISCGGGGSLNVVADIFSVFGTSPSALPPTSAPVAIGSSANARSSPSATLVEDAVIPRTSRHPSPATSNSESGADDIDAHAPISPDELALLIGSGSNGASNGVKRSHVASADMLDPLSALLSPPSSAHLGLSNGIGKHNADDGSNGVLDGVLGHCYWPSSLSSALAAPAPTATVGTPSALSSIVPASRSASCSDAVPFDINDLFGTSTVTAISTNPGGSSGVVASSSSSPLSETSKSLSPSVNSTTSKQAEGVAALDTANFIDSIFGKSSSSSSSSVA